jgi:uncharacterized protein (DUF2062 family)
LDHTEQKQIPQPGFLPRLGQIIYDKLIGPLVSSRFPPWYDARGVALGLIIGFAIPVGGQVLTLTLLRIAIRFKYLASLAFSLVSNPFNMIPLYYGYYLLGSVMVGRAPSMNFEVFERLMHPVMEKTYFWEALSAFSQLGCEILFRWVIAAVILAVVFGLVGYGVTYRVQLKRCKRLAKELGVKYTKLLDEMDHGLKKGSSKDQR